MASLHQKQGQEFDQIIDEIAKEVKFLSVFLGHEKLIIFHCQPEWLVQAFVISLSCYYKYSVNMLI